MTRMVTKKHLNSNEILFGGQLMKWMDETAFIAATRYTRKKMVTSSVDRIKFKNPVQEGTFLEIVSQVMENSGIKLRVFTKIFVEEMFGDEKKVAAESWSTFVCLNDDGMLQRIEQNEHRSSVKNATRTVSEL